MLTFKPVELLWCKNPLYILGIKLKEFFQLLGANWFPGFGLICCFALCIIVLQPGFGIWEISEALADFVSRNSSPVWVGVSYILPIIFTNNLSACIGPHWLCASAYTVVLQMNSLKCLDIHSWHLFCLIEIISSPFKLSFYDTSKLCNVLFSIIYKPYKLFLNFLFSCPRLCFYVSV